ncbi:integral membrane protein [Moelleriella libera RCEF 2490]|uniref:Integral membrane protein n=1 Tax=Moelleriella libera RCEF 2490 TaxID=1081109 RepID=A0A168BIB8_9HYPO|nr:integral membrane protein [Moelleriella libera RCEF 2490]
MENFDPARIPLGTPPAGQQSNLIDAESRAWIPRLAIYTTLPVTICFVLMRLAVRIQRKHALGWDDYLCVLALETSATTIMYIFAAALTKLSLLALFLRIFAPSRRCRLMVWAGVAFTVVSYVALLAAVALAVMGIVSDFYVIAIPLTVVSRLNLSFAKRLGLSALFATGLLACAFSVAGLVPRIANYRATASGAHDPFWISMESYGLAIAEINLGIVCASVPVTVPLLKGLTARLPPITSTLRRYLGRVASAPSDAADREASKEEMMERCNEKIDLQTFGQGSRDPRKAPPNNGNITVTRATEISTAPYSELRSVDMDYHRYLNPTQRPLNAAGAQAG